MTLSRGTSLGSYTSATDLGVWNAAAGIHRELRSFGHHRKRRSDTGTGSCSTRGSADSQRGVNATQFRSGR